LSTLNKLYYYWPRRS